MTGDWSKRSGDTGVSGISVLVLAAVLRTTNLETRFWHLGFGIWVFPVSLRLLVHTTYVPYLYVLCVESALGVTLAVTLDTATISQTKGVYCVLLRVGP